MSYRDWLADESLEERAMRKHGAAQHIQELEDWMDKTEERESRLLDERAALDHLAELDVLAWKDQRAGWLEPSPF